MSAASQTASASSAPASVAPHAAIAFFDSHPTSFPNLLRSSSSQWYARGHAQLAGALGLPVGDFDELKPSSIVPRATSGWLPSPEAEQAEIEEFLQWVEASSGLVRPVVEVLPPAVYADAASRVASAELHDFSPKGRIDDEIFEKHRDVWERITRGCALLKINVKNVERPIWRWAVRANRKFTGHEDDSAVADPNLYKVDNGPADTVVVSHKCNGSVLHLSARDIDIGGTTFRWVFLGSKKVHAGCLWSEKGGAADWLAKMKLFNAARHEYVAEMVEYILPHLNAAPARAQLILDTLAKFRLVVNAEYVSSIGTGPTDNERIYNMSESRPREAFGFMLTFNALRPDVSCELGLDMMAGLRLLHNIGFCTVSAFEIPLSELPRAKVSVLPLPDIEGAVLYYSNSARGLTQLEKWKSSGYVVLRAVREKLKPYIFGSRDYPGLTELIEKKDAESNKSSLACVKKVLTEAQLTAELTAAAPKKKKNARQRKKAAEAKKQAASSASSASASASVGDEAAAAIEAVQLESDGEESKDSAATIASVTVASPPYAVTPNTFLEFSSSSGAEAFQLDLVGSVLTEQYGARRVAAGVWRCPAPASAVEEARVRAEVQHLLESTLTTKPLAHALEKVIARVHGRIKAIDHIPMTPEEREAWLAESEAFLRWLTTQIVQARRWPPKEVMNQYSKLWSVFRAEAAAAKANAN